MDKTFKKIVLASRPKGLPDSDNFKIIEEALREPQKGEVLVRSLYISVDPYMRGRMSDRKSYVAPYAVNGTITGGVVGQVVSSSAPVFLKGDFVLAHYGWKEYSIEKAADIRKINVRRVPLSTALGILGMPGLTAYFGLLDIGKPQKNETVVVSGAAGAVGSIVGQIAKLNGCKVVGIAGSDAKISYLVDELGFDAGINYKTNISIHDELMQKCPDGVDIYFDNVGGKISDSILEIINLNARIIICGQIALYNLEKPDLGPRIQPTLLIKRALMKGFLVGDYQTKFSVGIEQLTNWYSDGKLKYPEHIVNGFENIPSAFIGLFKGENTGKQLVKVTNPE